MKPPRGDKVNTCYKQAETPHGKQDLTLSKCLIRKDERGRF